MPRRGVLFSADLGSIRMPTPGSLKMPMGGHLPCRFPTVAGALARPVPDHRGLQPEHVWRCRARPARPAAAGWRRWFRRRRRLSRSRQPDAPTPDAAPAGFTGRRCGAWSRPTATWACSIRRARPRWGIIGQWLDNVSLAQFVLMVFLWRRSYAPLAVADPGV